MMWVLTSWIFFKCIYAYAHTKKFTIRVSLANLSLEALNCFLVTPVLSVPCTNESSHFKFILLKSLPEWFFSHDTVLSIRWNDNNNKKNLLLWNNVTFFSLFFSSKEVLERSMFYYFEVVDSEIPSYFKLAIKW